MFGRKAVSVAGYAARKQQCINEINNYNPKKKPNKSGTSGVSDDDKMTWKANLLSIIDDTAGEEVKAQLRKSVDHKKLLGTNLYQIYTTYSDVFLPLLLQKQTATPAPDVKQTKDSDNTTNNNSANPIQKSIEEKRQALLADIEATNAQIQQTQDQNAALEQMIANTQDPAANVTPTTSQNNATTSHQEKSLKAPAHLAGLGSVTLKKVNSQQTSTAVDNTKAAIKANASSPSKMSFLEELQQKQATRSKAGNNEITATNHGAAQTNGIVNPTKSTVNATTSLQASKSKQNGNIKTVSKGISHQDALQEAIAKQALKNVDSNTTSSVTDTNQSAETTVVTNNPITATVIENTKINDNESINGDNVSVLSRDSFFDNLAEDLINVLDPKFESFRKELTNTITTQIGEYKNKREKGILYGHTLEYYKKEFLTKLLSDITNKNDIVSLVNITNDMKTRPEYKKAVSGIFSQKTKTLLRGIQEKVNNKIREDLQKANNTETLKNKANAVNSIVIADNHQNDASTTINNTAAEVNSVPTTETNNNIVKVADTITTNNSEKVITATDNTQNNNTDNSQLTSSYKKPSNLMFSSKDLQKVALRKNISKNETTAKVATEKTETEQSLNQHSNNSSNAPANTNVKSSAVPTLASSLLDAIRKRSEKTNEEVGLSSLSSAELEKKIKNKTPGILTGITKKENHSPLTEANIQAKNNNNNIGMFENSLDLVNKAKKEVAAKERARKALYKATHGKDEDDDNSSESSKSSFNF